MQPLAPTVAASGTYGCSLWHLRLQPVALTVAACGTYGCSLWHLRLQVREGLAYAELVAPIASAWPPAARESLERLVLAGWRQAILAPLRQPSILEP